MISGRDRRRRVADAPAAVEFGQRRREPLRGVGVQREQRLARGDGLAGPAVDAQPGTELHALPGTERPAPSRHTASPTAIASMSPIVPPRGAVTVSVWAPTAAVWRQVAALGGDQLAEPVHRGAVAQRLRRVDAVDAGGVEHLGGQRQRQLDDVVGAAAGQHLQRLGDLDGVADRPAQRRVHVGQQRAGGQPVLGAQLDHGARPARATRPRS